MKENADLDRRIAAACEEKLDYFEQEASKRQAAQTPETAPVSVTKIRMIPYRTHVLRTAAAVALVVALAAAAILLLPRLRGTCPTASLAASGTTQPSDSVPTATEQPSDSAPITTEQNFPAENVVQLLQEATEPFSGLVPGYDAPITGHSAEATLPGVEMRFRLVVGYDEKNDRTVVCLSSDIWTKDGPYVNAMSLRAEDTKCGTVPDLCVPETESGTDGEPYLTRSVPGRAAFTATGEMCVRFEDDTRFHGTLCLKNE